MALSLTPTSTSSLFFPSSTTFQTRTSSYPNIVTTPYVYRPTCDPHVLNSLCSGTLPSPLPSHLTSGGSPDTHFLCVNAIGNTWKACQPHIEYLTNDGIWAATSTSVGTEYRHAVCPQGWWALNVGLSDRRSERVGYYSREALSTATCCKSGDVLGQDIFKLYEDAGGRDEYGTVCVNTWTLTGGSTRFVEMESGEGRTSTPMPGGTAYYPGWSIQWFKTDTHLSPSWPTLTSNMLIPTWTEGMIIRAGEFDNRGPLTSTSSARPTITSGSYGDEEENADEAVGAKVPKKLWKIIVPVAVVGFFVVVAVVACFCAPVEKGWRKVSAWGKEKRRARSEERERRMGERLERVEVEKERVRAGEQATREAAESTSEAKEEGKEEEGGKKEAVEAELARLEELRRREVLRRQLNGK